MSSQGLNIPWKLLLSVCLTTLTSCMVDASGELTTVNQYTQPVASLQREDNSVLPATVDWSDKSKSIANVKVVPHSVDTVPDGLPDWRCQTRKVTLLRISHLATTTPSPRPFSFAVDSTISSLQIYVNSPRPITTVIRNPGGDPMTRKKRHTRNLSHNGQPIKHHAGREQPIGSTHSITSQSTRSLFSVFTRAQPIRDKLSERSRPIRRIHPFTSQPLKSNPPSKRERARRRRTRSLPKLSSLEFGLGNGKWNIQRPEIGQWTIEVLSLFDSIEVKGHSCIDFTFQFPGHNDDYSPAANTSAVVNLRIVGYQQVLHLFCLEMKSSTDTLLGTVNLKHHSVAPEIEALLTVPYQPFSLTLVGLDSANQRFQRLSPSHVTPTLFALRLASRLPVQLHLDHEYSFVVEIDNQGQTDGQFQIDIQCFGLEFISTKAQRDLVTLKQGGVTHVTVEVKVHEAPIALQTYGNLVVTVTSKGDYPAHQELRQTISVVPPDDREDHMPPFCRSVLVEGECLRHLPCAQQTWRTEVDVIDSGTGVKNVTFVHSGNATSDPEAYSDVRFPYARSVAMVSYMSSCCQDSFTLCVTDFADNEATCRFSASVPASTTYPTSFSRETSHSESSDTTSGLSPTKMSSASGVSQSVTSLSSTTWFSSSSPRVTSQTTPPSYPVWPHSAGTGSGSTGYMHMTSTPSINGNGTKDDSLRKRSSWSDPKFSKLRIVSIILGCVGLTAGLGLVLICIAYICMRKRLKRKVLREQGRHDSSGSDITMGSSWESRSLSSCPGSVRSEISLKVISRSDDPQNSDRKGSPLPRDRIATTNFTKRSRPEVYFHREKRNVDSGYFGSGGDIDHQGDDNALFRENTGRYDVNNVNTKLYATGGSGSSGGVASGRKSVSGPSTPKLTLTRVGQTYSSMMEVQKKLEEMERQLKIRKHNSDRREEMERQLKIRMHNSDRREECQLCYNHVEDENGGGGNGRRRSGGDERFVTQRREEEEVCDSERSYTSSCSNMHPNDSVPVQGNKYIPDATSGKCLSCTETSQSGGARSNDVYHTNVSFRPGLYRNRTTGLDQHANYDGGMQPSSSPNNHSHVSRAWSQSQSTNQAHPRDCNHDNSSIHQSNRPHQYQQQQHQQHQQQQHQHHQQHPQHQHHQQHQQHQQHQHHQQQKHHHHNHLGLPDEIEADNDSDNRHRSYSLVLLQDKRDNSPGTPMTYRKAALLPYVSLVKTKDGFGLVRSFPARLRANRADKLDLGPTDATDPNPRARVGVRPSNSNLGPVKVFDMRGNIQRMRFLSKSTGQVEKDSSDAS